MPSTDGGSTLAEIKRHHLVIRAVCKRCRRLAELDLDTLIDLFGADYRIIDGEAALSDAMTCDMCGCHDIEIGVEEEDPSHSQRASAWNRR